jgi:hypothetical protein
MLDIEKLKKKLKHRLEKEKREFATKSMHLVESPLKAGTELLVGPSKYSVPKDTFLVIIDEAPGAYWTHPVSYELHDIETGEITVIHEKYPLKMPEIEEELVALHMPDLPHLKEKGDEDFFEGPPVDLGAFEEQMRTISYDLSRPCVAHKHALFVAGMVDTHVDFQNDFKIMRDILIEQYGYDPNNIVILYGDGNNPANGLPVNNQGSVAALNAALDEYAPGEARELGPDDTLFLYTFNHGGWDGENAYLCMYPLWDSYYDHQLITKLNNIHCGNLIVAMNQCHSGGFIDEIVTTTGPSQVTILTACRYDQSAWPASTGGHGYFSVVLAAAINWGFPDAISPSFPGYVGTIASHDTNSDGMISVEEAWQFVHDRMHNHHYTTINGWETPQSAASPMEASDIMFWGKPDLIFEDVTPWWESPDVYLHDPAVIPDGITADPDNQYNWGDLYHPDTENRIVARVHNTGCAPARNVTVEFRSMSFGMGEETFLGDFLINDIEPGHHGFAWVDYNFPSNLVHTCIKVRADCKGDPAQPFGTSIPADDNQAQRNLDPLYSAPGSGNPKPAEKVIERSFTIYNDLDIDAVFRVSLTKGRYKSRHIQPEILKAESGLESLREIHLKPGEVKKIKIKFVISPEAQKGEKFHCEVEVERTRPKPSIVLGGVSFDIEIAVGWLEGRIVSRRKMPITKGTVTIRNIKHRRQKYSARVRTDGTFSFENIDPGPYRIQAKCKEGSARGSVLVKPNSVTSKVLHLKYGHWPPDWPPGGGLIPGGILTDESGNPLAHTLVAVRDTETGQKHLVRTDARGMYCIPSISPGEYEISMPEKKEMGPQKASIDILYLEEE